MKIEKTNTNIQTNDYSILDEYRDRLVDKKRANGTIKEYLRILEKLKTFLLKNDLQFNTANESDLKEFIDQNKGRSKATYNNILRTLKAFYKFMAAKYRIHNPVDDIGCERIEKAFYKDSLEPFQIRELFEYLESQIEKAKRRKEKDKRVEVGVHLRNLAYFGILINTGVRAGLSLKIKVEDIKRNSMENGDTIPTVSIEGKGAKSKKPRAISETTFRAVENYLKAVNNFTPSNYLFVSFRSGSDFSKPVGYHVMREGLDNAFKAIGIKGSFDNYKITPHSIRHTVGETATKERGLDYAQSLLDHQSRDTTKMYVGRNNEKELIQNPIDFDGVYFKK